MCGSSVSRYRSDENRHFTELATLLLGDAKQAKSFMSKAKLHSMEELEDSWWNLYEKLLSTGRAVELSLKIELEDFSLSYAEVNP